MLPSACRAWQQPQVLLRRSSRYNYFLASSSGNGISSRLFSSSSSRNDSDSNDNDNGNGGSPAARDATRSLLSSVSKRIQQQRDNPQDGATGMQPMVQDMLQSTLQRAYSTTQIVQDGVDVSQDDNILIENKTDDAAAATVVTLNTTVPEQQPHYEFPFTTRYRNHPAINNVALAHALWATVLRPHVDVAIDATCGNGYDSVKLAQLLFGTASGDDSNDCHAQLVCLDIQQEACDNTKKALQKYFAQQNFKDTFYDDHVQVLHASHEILPRPVDTNTTSLSIGLIVYNLGWLPNHHNEKQCVTKLETTLASLTDAALLVRNGGMISIITYPATSPQEDNAVRLFLECLALLSSKTRTWQQAVANTQSDNDDNDNDDASSHIATHVEQAMERVIAQGPPDQTWRVSQHDKLGMDNAPILITATRIK